MSSSWEVKESNVKSCWGTNPDTYFCRIPTSGSQEDEESNVKNEVKEKPADDDEKKNEEEIVSKEESIENISSDSIEEDSKDE